MSGCWPPTGATVAAVARSGGLPATWRAPAAVPVLGPHDVHVWRVLLDEPRWPADQLADTLSPEERDRASGFVASRDRRRFLIRRGLLRRLLAGYVDRPPHALTFTAGFNNKPELAPPAAGAPVRFNCSSSGPLALYAFARARRVGVDVEAVRGLSEVATIAELCFSPRERGELGSLADRDRDRALLRGWVMKEAYVKAVGEGLTRPLADVEVSVELREPCALRAVDGDPAVTDCWAARELAPAAGYVGAIVVEGQGPALSCWVVPSRMSATWTV